MAFTCLECKHLQAGIDSEPCVNCTSSSTGGRPTHWEAPESYVTAVVPKPTPKGEPKPTPKTVGMDTDTFDKLVEELRKRSLDTLLTKNANYANEDRLHNFRVGAALIGGTPAQAALGYMAKHMASLIDKVTKNDFSDRDDLLEKCQDIINYICFIWCCGNE